MKKIQQLFISFLCFLAQKKLKKIKPKVIAITGSVGKTTTKDYIAWVLSQEHRVKKTHGNYNTSLGIALTIFDETIGKNALDWISILLRSVKKYFNSESYAYFIVEMGADAPGDIQTLVKFLKPDISIVTAVSKTHMNDEQFENEKAIQHEKSMLVRYLKPEDKALLNADNALVYEMKDMTEAQVLLYGKQENADFKIEHSKLENNTLQYHIRYKNENYTFESQVPAEFLIYSALPAIALGLLENMSVSNIQKAVKTFTFPNGRFSILEGINDSIIIDSTYNASPEAVKNCLQALFHMSGKRKIAILGNMNELGKYTEEEHKKLGEVAVNSCNILLTFGEHAKLIGQQALAIDPNFETHAFVTHQKLIDFLIPMIQTGDTMLFKGSQNKVFLEEVVKYMLKDPSQAQKVLVRQGKEWQGKKDIILK